MVKELQETALSFRFFEEQVEKTPDQVAVMDGERSITYATLNAHANQLANYLLSLGINREEVVGIYLQRSFEFIVTAFAVNKAGAAYMPLNPEHPADRIQYEIDDARPVLVISSLELQDKHAVTGNVIIWENLEWDLEKQSDANPNINVCDGDLSCIFYTSGSSGRPKGVMLCHFAQSKLGHGDIRVGEVSLVMSSTSFTLITREVFWPLENGGTLLIVPPGREKDPAWIAKVIREYEISVLHFVPSLLSLFLDVPRVGECESVAKVFTVGESLTPSVQRKFFAMFPDGKLFDFYGCTEATALTFREIKKGEDLEDLIIFGPPRPEKKVYLLDKDLKPVSVGECGEIYASGQISRGYINNTALTKQQFLPNPFSDDPGCMMYRTGDLGRFLPDGRLEYLGRVDFQVKVRGIRIELGEIENILRQHPGLANVVVMANGEGVNVRLVALCHERNGSATPEEELRSLVNQNLPQYMWPSKYLFLDEWPLNASGKSDLRKLREIAKESVFQVEEVAIENLPNGEVQRGLAELFRVVLDLHEIDVRKSFFELGGDSYLAVGIAGKINEKWDCGVEVYHIYENSSIIELEKLILSKLDAPSLDLPISGFFRLSGRTADRNLFCFNVNEAWAEAVSAKWNVYVSFGIWGEVFFDFRKSLKDVTDEYLRGVLATQSSGPYFFLGYSYGGLIAHMVACRLVEMGETVRGIAMIEPVPAFSQKEEARLSNWSSFWNIVWKERRIPWRLGGAFLFNWMNKPAPSAFAKAAAHEFCKKFEHTELIEHYSGDVDFIRGNCFKRTERDQWKEHIHGDFREHVLSCNDHLQIIEEKYCQEWAGIVDMWIDS